MGPAKMNVIGQTLHPAGGADRDVVRAADVINAAAFPVMVCGMFSRCAAVLREGRMCGLGQGREWGHWMGDDSMQ